MPGFASHFAAEFSKRFLKYRWMTALFVAVFVVILEIVEHRPAQFNLLDPNFLRETMIFGVILPASWGLILTLLAHAGMEKQKVVHDLDQQQAFGQQLNKASRWDDLTESIVKFPRTVVSVERTALHVYNPDRDRFELASEWTLDGSSRSNLTPILTPQICHTCLISQEVSDTTPWPWMPCQHINPPSTAQKYRQYCLPLKHSDLPVALLHLDFPTDITVTTNQIRVINNAAHEMALAIEGARLQLSVISQAEATEAERQRIAQNLHDTLGQNVSYLRLKLDQLSGEDALWEISLVKQELERMREIAEDAYQQVRGTLADLQPTNSTDLTTALLEQSRLVGDRSNFNVSLDTIGKPQPLPAHTKRQVLFICGEALNNIEKHAQAKSVSIRLEWEKKSVTIRIQDDGQGFDPEEVKNERHFGLQIMQERTQDIQGQLTVDAAIGKGTLVTLLLPLVLEGQNV